MSLPIIETMQNNINNLKNTKQNIKNAINTDYDFITDEQIESYPNLIKQSIAYYKNRIPHDNIEGTNITITNALPLKFENIIIKGNTEQNTRILPEGYIQLDYIESTGTQYIDTEIATSNTIKIEVEATNTFGFQRNGRIYGGALFGGRSSSTNSNFSYVTGDLHDYVGIGNNFIEIDKNINTDLLKIQYDASSVNIECSNYKYTNNNLSINITNSFNIYISANNQNNTIASYGTYKVYKFKIYDNDALVRNFIPCKNGNNEIGLYDLVSGTFFSNQGTGAFVAGNEVTIPNPDYSQDIHIVTGNNSVEVQGENLFDENILKQETNYNTYNSTTQLWTTNSGGSYGRSILYNATGYTSRNINKLVPLTSAGTYTLKLYDFVNNTSYASALELVLFDNEGLKISQTTQSSNFIKFTIDKPCYMDLCRRNNSGTISFSKVMLVQGDYTEQTLPDYTPYYHADYPINLGSLELCKIGDYQDYLYKENGKWYKYEAIKEWKSEDYINNVWQKTQTTDEYSYFFTNSKDTLIKSGIYNGYCNLLNVRKSLLVVGTEVKTDTINYGDSGYAKIRIKIKTNRLSEDSAQGLKNWFSSVDVTSFIILATPTSTQITDTTLISQLNAIDKAKAGNGAVIITTSGNDLAPVFSATVYIKEVE